MTAEGFVALRRARVRHELERVSTDIEDWLKRWKANPGPQTSQITRCGEALDGMMDRLRAELEKPPESTGALASARNIEWDLAIVERAFRQLEQRFDQRNNSKLQATLDAADELIWSFLRPARAILIDSKEALGDKLPLPLAYIDPAFSPTATPRIKPESTLPARDRGLANMLRVLPVPLIGLPSGIVEEPWWLVLIAHEVGHHVQYDAEADAEAVVNKTREVLKSVTGDETWEAWRHEVFADLFAVVMLGPVAIEATAELEWDLPEKMADKRTLYPPVIVRLALMAEGARAAGHPDVPYGADSWADTLKNVSEPRRGVIEGQLKWVPEVVAAILDMPVGHGSLRKLAKSHGAPVVGAKPDQNTLMIQRSLRGGNVAIGKGFAVPPQVVREAFQAYRHLAQAQDLERAEKQRLLRQLAPTVIAKSGDPEQVTRAGVRGLDSTTGKDVDGMLEALREVERE